jgi:hypothetical protein
MVAPSRIAIFMSYNLRRHVSESGVLDDPAVLVWGSVRWQPRRLTRHRMC